MVTSKSFPCPFSGFRERRDRLSSNERDERGTTKSPEGRSAGQLIEGRKLHWIVLMIAASGRERQIASGEIAGKMKSEIAPGDQQVAFRARRESGGASRALFLTVARKDLATRIFVNAADQGLSRKTGSNRRGSVRNAKSESRDLIIKTDNIIKVNRSQRK